MLYYVCPLVSPQHVVGDICHDDGLSVCGWRSSYFAKVTDGIPRTGPGERESFTGEYRWQATSLSTIRGRLLACLKIGRSLQEFLEITRRSRSEAFLNTLRESGTRKGRDHEER